MNKMDDTFQIITNEFLESQLDCKIHNFTVENGTKPGDNYQSVLYSISVQILPDNDGTFDSTTSSFNPKGAIRHYILKCYPCHPSRQKFLNKSNHFYRELTFYQTLAKDLVQFQTEIIADDRKHEILPLPIPPFHGGKSINFSEIDTNDSTDEEKVYDPLENFILLTDMRKAFDFKMTDKRKGLDGDHVKLAFNELATLHALSWAYRKKVKWDLLDKYPFMIREANKRKTGVWINLLKENVETAVASIDSVKGKGNSLSNAVLKFCENSRTVLDYFSCGEKADELKMQKLLQKTVHHFNQKSVDHWRVVCHGDIWSNNMLFQYNKDTGKPQNVVLVDFPLVKLACPTLDLACLVYTSTRSDFRHKHLEECLQAYHDRFLEVCNKIEVECLPNFSLDSIRSRFQTSKLVGLLIALISLPLSLIDEEKEINMEKVDAKSTMAEMLQDACASGKGSALFRDWIVELVEDLYNDGVSSEDVVYLLIFLEEFAHKNIVKLEDKLSNLRSLNSD